MRTKVTDRGRNHNGTSRRDEDAATRPAGDATLARQIADELRGRIGPERYRAWFDSGTTQLHVDGAKLQVDSQSQFVADWIDRHFAGELRMVARKALGDGARVDVTVVPARSKDRPGESLRESAGGHPGGQADPRSHRRSGRRDKKGAPPLAEDSPGQVRECTHVPRSALRRLSDFVVGDSNRLAFTAAQRLAEGADPADAGALLIYGECGVGKTHLLQGIVERYSARKKRPSAARYLTAEQFTNEYITAVRHSTLDAFRKEYRRRELLAIDDVHFLASKTATQNEFLHTIDAIDLSGARLVLASDEHPRKIAQLSPSLVSRLVSRLVVRIDPPDRLTRVAIVKKLAEQRGLPLLDAAAESVATRCTGSVREIQGVLAQLFAMRELDPNPAGACIGSIDTDRLFRQHDPIPRTGPVRLAAIIDAVCEQTGIDRCDLFGKSRHARIVLSRGLVTHLARSLTNHSYPEIAQALGRSCHSTVHAAARRIVAKLRAAERGQTDEPHDDAAPDDSPARVRSMVEELRARILRSNRRTGE